MRNLNGATETKNVDKLLFSPEDAAVVLGIGRTKVYKLMADGDIRSVRIGGSRRVSWGALSDFVAHLEDPSAQPADDMKHD